MLPRDRFILGVSLRQTPWEETNKTKERLSLYELEAISSRRQQSQTGNQTNQSFSEKVPPTADTARACEQREVQNFVSIFRSCKSREKVVAGRDDFV